MECLSERYTLPFAAQTQEFIQLSSLAANHAV
jgi:hypothetical protein